MSASIMVSNCKNYRDILELFSRGLVVRDPECSLYSVNHLHLLMQYLASTMMRIHRKQVTNTIRDEVAPPHKLQNTVCTAYTTWYLHTGIYAYIYLLQGDLIKCNRLLQILETQCSGADKVRGGARNMILNRCQDGSYLNSDNNCKTAERS